ncbi:hypothetical protein Ddye_029923 [Dipteronia dyeriana]|uniref:Ferredoxin thioredoxin reductase alpha chain domain-containing protein n=1 Tax=Dipteronia dyeriana TaxID=168575 RepID=A0AAD9WL46_9ROSI|nr:hypothetical protein Ddye_029923 [Dipteronia dyeriana]
MNMMMTTTSSATTLPMSSPINTRPPCFSGPHIVSSCNCNYNRRKGLLRLISCEVAVKSNNSTTSLELDDKNPSASAPASSDEEEEEEEAAKIGSRIKVKVPLKVYHVPRVPEVDLTDMEGVIKQYVVNWKGKRISANLPYKVQFITQIEGRGPVKFFAHLKEDEFDYLD